MKTEPWIINPVARSEQQCFWKDYRITVLKENLIRIEKKGEKGFEDRMTQLALCRDFGVHPFQVKKTEDACTFFFSTYELVIKESLENSFILYKGEKLSLDNQSNLKGTYATLDKMDGDQMIDGSPRQAMGEGVCAKNGVAILEDHHSYCFNTALEFVEMNKDTLDLYLFFYPHRYKEAVKSLFDLSSYPPLLPAYVFGNWWSRFYDYSQESYLYLMRSFQKQDIPFTVATIDMDWHYSSCNGRDIFKDLNRDQAEFIAAKTDEKTTYYCKGWREDDTWSWGWTGFSFNQTLFPSPKQLFEELKKLQLHTTLNLHPADGLSFYEDAYDRCKQKFPYPLGEKETIPFDLTDPANRTLYFEDVLQPLEQQGVDFWWIDWQQGEISNLPLLTPMWLCNHYFFLENKKIHDRPLILSRYAGLGSHRYPLGFSGDTIQSYASLRYVIETTAQASNAGFSYWSHDIGGHYLGVKDGEQFLKFVQFGVFSPINRLHCACKEMYNKHPQMFLKGYGSSIQKYLRLRHQMIPYLYSFMFQTAFKGEVLLQPLYYQYPEDEACYEASQTQYLFANDLLVRPFQAPADGFQMNHFSIYFPQDNFYDLFHGYRYPTKTTVAMVRENDAFPVFLREGAFFILDQTIHGNEVKRPLAMDIYLALGNGSLCFQEDEENEDCIKTVFSNQEQGEGCYSISIQVEGNQTLHQQNRQYHFLILNAPQHAVIRLENARLLEKTSCGEHLEITMDQVMFQTKVLLSIEGKVESLLQQAKKLLCRRLGYLDDDNEVRQSLFDQIQIAKTVQIVEVAIQSSCLQNVNKAALYEVLAFAKNE